MAVSLLDLFFPKQCVSCNKLGAYICDSCFSQVEFIDKPICPICQRHSMGGRTHPGCSKRQGLDGLIVACSYKGPIKKAISKVKYKWIYDIEKVFVEMVVANLWRFDSIDDPILIPIPLHSKRKKWRGFNQAEILAKRLSLKFGVKTFDLLNRNIETIPQVGLNRAQRLKNVQGAFSMKKEINLDGQNIILVDDVYTSGATMGECCSVLKKVGAGEIWGMTVALG